MARGWESKSVEAQQAEAGEQQKTPHSKLSAQEAALRREKENLRLARRQVLQQMESSSNPRHQKMLSDALAELDARLGEMERASATESQPQTST